MSDEQLTLGQRVMVVGKDVQGSIAYIGHPTRGSGKWIGVILDEPKGKTNGSIQGRSYFSCKENYGVFVRENQLQLLEGEDTPMETSKTTSNEESQPSPTNQLSGSATSLESSWQSLTTSTERTISPDMDNYLSYVEIDNLKTEVEDLKVKLETLRVARAEDRERLHEVGQLRLQLDQANEFKAKIMESQAQLQRDLQRAKQETSDAKLEVFKARSDREIAEETTSRLQRDLRKCHDELSDTRFDLMLMKAEMTAAKDIHLKEPTPCPLSSSPAHVHTWSREAATIVSDIGLRELDKKTGKPVVTTDPDEVTKLTETVSKLRAQNLRLRVSLVNMQDLSMVGQNKLQKMHKSMEEYKLETRRTEEKLSARVEQLEKLVEYLRAQLDGATNKHLEESKPLLIQLEEKEDHIKELTATLKVKQEKLSEMQTSLNLAESSLAASERWSLDVRLRADQLTRHLGDANKKLERKEQKFKEKIEGLQQDIDSLKTERRVLWNKLKMYTKARKTHHTHHQEAPMKVPAGAAAWGLIKALQHQLKVLTGTLERERAAQLAANQRAERAALRALRPLEPPAAAAARQRRLAAAELERELARLHSEWTLFVARSGLVRFPAEPGRYSAALRAHRERQREERRALEERLAALQGEARRLLLLHRPWRCVEADFAEFPAPDLTAALSSRALHVGTLQYTAPPDAARDQTIYVTPTQLMRLRELVSELQSDDIKLDLQPLEGTVCAA